MSEQNYFRFDVPDHLLVKDISSLLGTIDSLFTKLQVLHQFHTQQLPILRRAWGELTTEAQKAGFIRITGELIRALLQNPVISLEQRLFVDKIEVQSPGWLSLTGEGISKILSGVKELFESVATIDITRKKGKAEAQLVELTVVKEAVNTLKQAGFSDAEVQTYVLGQFGKEMKTIEDHSRDRIITNPRILPDQHSPNENTKG